MVMMMMTMMMMIMTDPFTTNLVVKGLVVKGSVVKGAHPMMMMILTISIEVVEDGHARLVSLASVWLGSSAPVESSLCRKS